MFLVIRVAMFLVRKVAMFLVIRVAMFLVIRVAMFLVIRVYWPFEMSAANFDWPFLLMSIGHSK